MKDTIRISVLGLALAGAMALAMYIPSKTRQVPASLTPEEISWVEFCKSNGYDLNDNREEVINEYLDAWVGSAVEEEILLSHGIEP